MGQEHEKEVIAELEDSVELVGQAVTLGRL